ncbi:MAG TPA: RNA polymerase sigma factor [Propionibacteriaceae bacterium]|nr:RNA polymerase sigma factor [Propionibacteriaceae bacterium]
MASHPDASGDEIDAGEDSVFSQAYRDLAPAVLGYLRARGVPDPEAVTQDVFIALYPRVGSVTGGAAGLKTLVFTIAHARSVDHHRHLARAPRLVGFDPEYETRSAPSTEDLALGRGLGIGILTLLDGLSADQREVIALRVIADLSLEQTAAITNRSTGAVKQLQRRALLALRHHLARQQGERDERARAAGLRRESGRALRSPAG